MPKSACEITVEETSAKTEDKHSSKCRILPSDFILQSGFPVKAGTHKQASEVWFMQELELLERILKKKPWFITK